jgi:glycosyltransferase 2 family protein
LSLRLPCVRLPSVRFPRGARFAVWASGILLLFGLVALVAHLGEERAFLQIARDSDPAWLIAASGLQLATYACAGFAWQRGLCRFGTPPPFRHLFGLGLAKLFTDQAMPSAGVSGTILVVRILVQRGVARGAAVATVLAAVIGYYAAYAVSVAATLAILWLAGDLSHVWLGLATVLGLIAVAVPFAVLRLQGAVHARAERMAARLPMAKAALAAIAEAPPEVLRDRELLLETTAIQLAIFLLDAATLWVMLRAVGTGAPFTVVFATFVTASMIGTLAIIPGGVGIFEGASLAMLHLFGVALPAALAATLLLRGFTFLLPMLPGLWFVRHQLREPAEEADGLLPENALDSSRDERGEIGEDLR